MEGLLKRIISILFIIIFLFVDIIVIFNGNIFYRAKIQFLFDNWLLLIISFIVSIISFKIFGGVLEKVNQNRFIIISTIFLFVFEIFVSIFGIFRAGWDAGLILNFAYDNSNVFDDYVNLYFSTYPNNTLLLFYEMFVAAFVKTFGYDFKIYNLILVIVNCIIFSVVGVMIYYSSRKITNNKKISLLTWIIYFILVGSSGWLMIPYSDSIGLLFPSLIIFIYIFYNKNINLKVGLISLLAFLGYQIKPQIVICFIAIVIIELINLICKKKYKNIFKYAFITVCTFLLINVPINYLKYNVMKIDKNRQLGLTHFLMMGSNYDFNGLFNNGDVEISVSILDKGERQRKNLEVFKNRMIEYKFSGILTHIKNKTLTNFNDGTFFFGGEGSFYNYIYPQSNLFVSDLVKNCFYSTGKYYDYFSTVRQSVWLLVLFLNLFCWKKKMSNNVLVLQLSLIGLFLFETLFEARSRYLFIYIPFFIMTAMYGFNCFYERCIAKK